MSNSTLPGSRRPSPCLTCGPCPGNRSLCDWLLSWSECSVTDGLCGVIGCQSHRVWCCSGLAGGAGSDPTSPGHSSVHTFTGELGHLWLGAGVFRMGLHKLDKHVSVTHICSWSDLDPFTRGPKGSCLPHCPTPCSAILLTREGRRRNL